MNIFTCLLLLSFFFEISVYFDQLKQSKTRIPNTFWHLVRVLLLSIYQVVITAKFNYSQTHRNFNNGGDASDKEAWRNHRLDCNSSLKSLV